MTEHDPLLPEIEAAKYLHQHPQTLRKQRREGTLPFPYLKIGGRFHYRRSALDQYLEQCEVAPKRAAG